MNAPTAAWWGGFYERLIKILKDLLKRILGTSRVNYEELETILCECEAVMNGRPLTYVQDDSNSTLEPLTPSCFIQPITQTEVTDLDIIDENSLNSRLRYLKKLKDDFKERFKNEYLTNLVQRGKEKVGNLKIGDIVLIETEEKRVKWPLGMVTNIFTGKDGVGRTAEVRTSTGGIKVRPFQRLFPLELHSETPVPVTSPNLVELHKSNLTNQSTDITQEKPVVATCSGRLIKLPSKYKI